MSFETDDLLAALIHADDDVRAEESIESLLTDHADPIVRGIINRTVFRFSGNGPQTRNVNVTDIQEAEDLVSQVHLRLLAKLREIRSQGTGLPIKNFPAYVAGLAQNECNNYLRHKRPERFRLKNKAQYILSNDGRFAIWEDGSARRVCGLAEWRHQDLPVAAESTLVGLEKHRGVLPVLSSDPRADEIARLLHVMFRLAGAPVRLDDAVKVLADAVGIADNALDQRASPGSGDGLAQGIQGHAPRDLEERLQFEWTWQQIGQLPREQKIALLLSLSDDAGDSLLAILLHDKLISVGDIATALEMETREVAAIWSDLPLDDARIASMLGVTRRKISHYRLSARRRLTRRMERESAAARRGVGL